MDLQTLATIGKEVGLPMVAMMGVMYILYQVILSLREEHQKNQEWFAQFVNENNHQKTDLIVKVADNIAKNTSVMEMHTKTLESLVDRLNK